VEKTIGTRKDGKALGLVEGGDIGKGGKSRDKKEGETRLNLLVNQKKKKSKEQSGLLTGQKSM